LASGKLAGKWELLNMETILGKGKLYGNNFWTRGKLWTSKKLLDKGDNFWSKKLKLSI
jgi:hypothetical protein